MGKPWVFISFGALALALSSFVFSLYYLLNIRVVEIQEVGGLTMMIGGLLILFGMYLQCKSWRVPTR